MSPIVIMPMAGYGNRFRDAGYSVPKPFLPCPIDDDRRPLFRVASEVARGSVSYDLSDVVCVVRPEDERMTRIYTRDIAKVVVTPPTRGASETVLRGLRIVRQDRPVMVINCDQCVSYYEGLRFEFNTPEALTFEAAPDDPRWSYVYPDGRIVEKPSRPLTREATCGIYTAPSAFALCDAIEEQIKNDERHGPNAEFYFAPVLNKLGRVRAIRTTTFIPLGTPEDYEAVL